MFEIIPSLFLLQLPDKDAAWVAATLFFFSLLLFVIVFFFSLLPLCALHVCLVSSCLMHHLEWRKSSSSLPTVFTSFTTEPS